MLFLKCNTKPTNGTLIVPIYRILIGLHPGFRAVNVTAMEKNLTIGAKLHAIIVAKNISRDTLSRVIGASPSSLDDWLSDKREPIETVAIVADLLLAEEEQEVQILWHLLSKRYERAYGEPVPKKGERKKKRKRRA
jgi:transcriptional regulator with XRE-family HTH domain